MLMPTSHSQPAGLPRAMLGMPSRQLFASRDLQETCSQISRVMKPHALQVVGPRQRLDARMHHLTFGDVSLSRLSHGAEVRIEPGELSDFFLVMMPLHGHARCAAAPRRWTPRPTWLRSSAPTWAPPCTGAPIATS